MRGICSNYLADVKPGDELVMTGPAGTALLLADNPWNKRIVCVSTGAVLGAALHIMTNPSYPSSICWHRLCLLTTLHVWKLQNSKGRVCIAP